MSAKKYNMYGQPIKKDNLFYESLFWLFFYIIITCGSCAIWYVIFRTMGIVV